MFRVFIVIGVIITISVIILLYLKNQSVVYEVDVRNICEGRQTTLAPRQIEKVVIKKSDEAKFIEDSKKEKKCFWKM